MLNLDPEVETARIVESIRAHVSTTLRKRDAVLGLSGGVDSSVVAGLCARALGREKVLGLLKRCATRYLHLTPLLVEPVPEVTRV